MMLSLGLLKYHKESSNLVIETREGTSLLVENGTWTHVFFLEVFLLDRNMSKEIFGGTNMLVSNGSLAHRCSLFSACASHERE